MLKLAGAALLLLAGTLLGFIKAAQLARRPRELRQLQQALQRLETEIGYGAVPLPDAIAAASASSTGPLAKMLSDLSGSLREAGRSAADCWQAALDKGWPATAMTAADREILRQLGGSLGASGRQDQLKHLRLAAIQLQAQEETAREEERTGARMYRQLGMLSAALVVILMY